MNGENFIADEEFKRCADFHGHVCPGLAIGYRATKSALERLKEQRSVDEEIVALVETDNCGLDALQVLSGCTAGKGNLIQKNYGKNVYTLVSRKSGEGVRVSLRADAFEVTERHKRLIDKVRSDEASDEDRKAFQSLHDERTREILSKPEEVLFQIRRVKIDLPPKAVIEPSENCDNCGEPTMHSKLIHKNGKKLCKECSQLG
jgi:formylmethanofuran dehydrogenase subunit E